MRAVDPQRVVRRRGRPRSCARQENQSGHGHPRRPRRRRPSREAARRCRIPDRRCSPKRQGQAARRHRARSWAPRPIRPPDRRRRGPRPRWLHGLRALPTVRSPRSRRCRAARARHRRRDRIVLRPLFVPAPRHAPVPANSGPRRRRSHPTTTGVRRSTRQRRRRLPPHLRCRHRRRRKRLLRERHLHQHHRTHPAARGRRPADRTRAHPTRHHRRQGVPQRRRSHQETQPLPSQIAAPTPRRRPRQRSDSSISLPGSVERVQSWPVWLGTPSLPAASPPPSSPSPPLLWSSLL